MTRQEAGAQAKIEVSPLIFGEYPAQSQPCLKWHIHIVIVCCYCCRWGVLFTSTKNKGANHWKRNLPWQQQKYTYVPSTHFGIQTGNTTENSTNPNSSLLAPLQDRSVCRHIAHFGLVAFFSAMYHVRSTISLFSWWSHRFLKTNKTRCRTSCSSVLPGSPCVLKLIIECAVLKVVCFVFYTKKKILKTLK